MTETATLSAAPLSETSTAPASSDAHLSEYIRGRRVLLLGDSILKRGWPALLSKLLLGEVVPLAAQFTIRRSNTIVCHEACGVADDPLGGALPDIVLLGIGEDQATAEKSRFAQTIVTRLAELYRGSTSVAVRQPLPQLVIFPTGEARIYQQALAGHVRESRHFVQVLEEDPIDGDTVQRLGNAIIAALEERICHSIGFAFPEGVMRLRKWLDNFLPADRPAAFALVERLRFYSAEAMVRMLDSYLQSASTVRVGRSSILGGDRCAPGAYLFSNLGRPFKSASAVLQLVGRSNWIGSVGHNLYPSGPPPRDRRPAIRAYEALAARVFAQVAGHPDGEVLNVILVDDVVGSGAQLTSYLSKFLIKELRATIGKSIAEDTVEAVWQNTLRRMAGGWSNLRLHALFLIGIENKEFEALFEVPLEPVATGDTSYRSVHGKTLVKIVTATGTISVPLEVHVVDYAKSVSSLSRDGSLDTDATERLLTRPEYRNIVRPRAKEHPLQFEPYGWKDGGGLVVTYANCPGNTLPIFWADGGSRPWFPLFKRFFSPWDDGALNPEKVLSLVDDVMRNSKADIAHNDANRLRAYLLHVRSRWDKGEIARHLCLPLADVEEAVTAFQVQLNNEPNTRELFRTVIRATSQ